MTKPITEFQQKKKIRRRTKRLKQKIKVRTDEKFTLILFLILNSFLFSIGLNRDVDIIDMPLHEVLAVLSKECGRNLICSKEAKDIVIDTYFNKGEDLDSVLGFLAETYGLTMKKENNNHNLYAS